MSLPIPYQTPEHQPYYWANSTPRAALLVHSFPGTPAELRAVGSLLFEQGWSVRGLLLPGFGPQIEQIEQHTHIDWIAAVQAALREMRRGYQTVLLVGLSMGAALALHTARNDTPDGLLLFAPFIRIDNGLLDAVFPLAARLFRYVRPFKDADFANPQLRAQIDRIMPDADLDDAATQEALRAMRISTRVLREVRTVGQLGRRAAVHVRTPVLILQGRADEIAPPRRTRQLARRIRPLHGYVELPGAHFITNPRGESWLHVRMLVTQFATSMI